MLQAIQKAGFGGKPAFVRVVRVPAARIPSSVNGLPIHICLDRLSAAFCRYGSAALRADILNVRSQSPEIAGLTLAEMLGTLSLADPAADLL